MVMRNKIDSWLHNSWKPSSKAYVGRKQQTHCSMSDERQEVKR